MRLRTDFDLNPVPPQARLDNQPERKVRYDSRVNNSLFASLERKALNRIAPLLPVWCTPNGMTMVGVAGGLIVVLGYGLSNYSPGWLWLANAGLAVHWLGDSLDGTLARLRQIERPRYGFYLDQAIDTLGNVLIAIGVGISGAARLDIALLVLAAFHMLSIQVYVRAIVDREFHLAVGRLGPTEMRIGILAMNLGITLFGAPTLTALPCRMTWCDILMSCTGLGLFGLYAHQMRGHLRRLSSEDPVPAAPIPVMAAERPQADQPA